MLDLVACVTSTLARVTSGIWGGNLFDFADWRLAMDFDLFGFPIRPGHGCRGRPRHMPSHAQRQLVRQLHTNGLAQPAIAKALGITVPTLLLNYPIELESKSRTGARRAEQEKLK